MKFSYLPFVVAALILASFDVAAQIPANAHRIPMDMGSWSCNRGYQKSGDSCLAECKRKPSTCLRTFIKDKEYISASDLYNKNRDLFRTAKESKRRSSELDELSKYLNDEYDARIADLQSELVTVSFDAADPAGWGSMRSMITSIEELLAAYRSHAILLEEKYGLQSVRDIDAQLQTTIESIANQRGSAFLAYDHTLAIGFFDVYPGEVIDDTDRRTVVREAWSDIWPIVDSMTTDNQLKLIEAWTDRKPSEFHSMFGADLSVAIADSYYLKAVRALSVQVEDVDKFFIAIAAGNRIGLTPSEAVSSKFLLVLTAAHGDFGLNLHFDKMLPPFSGSPVLPDEAKFDSYDVVIFVRVTNIELSERTVSTGTIRSKYEERIETITNPAYISAQSAYDSAINNYNIAQSNSNAAHAAYNNCQAQIAGTWNSGQCFIPASNAGEAAGQLRVASDTLERAQQRLQNTDPSVTKPVYRDYEIPVSNVALEKIVSGSVAVIVPIGGEARVVDFRLADTKSIDVAVNVHPKDSGAARGYFTPDDLEGQESEVFPIDVFDVVSTLRSAETYVRPASEIGKLLVASPVPERAAPTQFDVSSHTLSANKVSASHPAIGGVVVVKTPLGSVGAGFYVTENLLLTNYHVVAGSSFVEIELFDGRSNTGQVINTDIDRDLALVRTTQIGQPLILFTGNSLPLGESVIAIGHPKGLNFSFTKGIISSVRELESTTSNLGRRFLFVQTDTAISPGNSGGPLLLDNKVIGVNTQKLVDTQVEGIGFALHYAEIARFLAVSMSN